MTRAIRDVLFDRFGYDPGEKSTSDAMMRCCEKLRFDPVQDYLWSLKWDGVRRVDTWLTTYVGAADTPLTRAQGRIVLQAMVARAFEPGTKFDHVVVFEGPEGARKSTIVRVLANGRHNGKDFFSDSPVLHLDERAQMEKTMGIWAYELAELAMMKKGDEGAIKNFITKDEERARAAYGKFLTVQPRTVVFFGTFNTNATTGDLVGYLNWGDRRRWWPVLVGKIDIAALERDRDQLFAEVMEDYSLYLAGIGDPPKLYLPPELEAEARGNAELREKQDVLTDGLSTLFDEVLFWATQNHPSLPGNTRGNTSEDVFKGRPIKRVTREGEIVPLACVYTDTNEVWVSIKCISELAKGRNPTAAMTKHGWRKIRDRRSGKNIEGWARQAEDPLA
jgi:putative DNA primase/helicase